MRYFFYGNVSILSLLLLSILFTLLFITKDDMLSEKKITHNYHYQYLNNNFNLIIDLKRDENILCSQLQKEKIQFLNYSFNCIKKSFFIKKPTKSYIEYQQIRQYLNSDDYKDNIYLISKLDELPLTSIDNPKIVKVLDDIDGELPNHFYGIIITDNYFDIKGRYNIYGVLYSSYDNKRKERNISYKKEVIENIDNQLSSWSYLSHSKSLLSNEID
ncbi:hypothetical protein A6B43_04740 [Vespertiliibacter pulmonis]|uniref:Uncharacterized protein DUF2572 n=1 Tax=Vespertiliibacter pulmonis TaxID=1443036 RepID=A0A3N4WE56_9PAST|nr:DUF2572 family protein [Vespertiliibacter pulmonis]QLB20881.1 hypothetical protein A6B43_04740 [Vespertiliibacter pulmonis]RPE83534.1 uncharacterized protein DUF2572 [Vespertiliibacter pulmonis]